MSEYDARSGQYAGDRWRADDNLSPHDSWLAGEGGVADDGGGDHAEEPVVIDCDSCAMRMLACGDCVVSVLLGAVPGEFEAAERRALDVLADSGLVPPLRLVPMPPAAQPAGRTGRAAADRGDGARPRSRRGGGYSPPAAASTG